MKLVIELLGVHGLEQLYVERNRRICLDPRACGLAEFIFSDRYYLTASALARVCPLMMGLMLWIASFNRCRTSLLLLVLNAFLKVRAVCFKAGSTISSVFQCSKCSAGAPPTCTFSTIIFLGVEGPFTDAVGPSRVIWHNYRLTGRVGAFSQLFKRFFKLLEWWFYSSADMFTFW